MAEPKLGRPTSDPVEIRYKRYRHKERKFLVEVERVLNFRGKHGWYTVVTVRKKGAPRSTSLPASTLLATYTPVGRRLRRRSRWEILSQDED